MGKKTPPTKTKGTESGFTPHPFFASVLSRSILRVIADFHDEILAKDQAYRFIIKEGLLDKFREYCQTEIKNHLKGS